MTTTAHRINLRGPWEFSWSHDARTRKDSTRAWPPRGEVILPCNWDAEFADSTGELALTRGFHRPTNLDADESVVLVFDGMCNLRRAGLNDRPLEQSDAAIDPPEFDVTQILEDFNVLLVFVDAPPTRLSREPDRVTGGNWGLAGLEIRRLP